MPRSVDPDSIVREWPRLARMRREGDVAGLILELQDQRARDAGKGIVFTVREHAVSQLGRMGSREAVGPIASLHDDPVVGVRRQVAWALGKLRDPAAVSTLAQAVGDEDEAVRRLAAKSLGQIGDRAACPYLVATLGDPELYVQLAAARALGRIGCADAVKPVVAATREVPLRHPLMKFRFARALTRLRLKNLRPQG